MESSFNLERFVTAQQTDFDIALRELLKGKKESHWIWYIFPQLKGLGRSAMSDFYGISGIKETKAYLIHSILGERYKIAVKTVLECGEIDAFRIFGSPDTNKFHSSLTLFHIAELENEIFTYALEKFFEGKLDQNTIRLLKDNG